MAQYIVRSGQNIYDVAMTLYGSVEGIFDLLASNSWLNMETRLTYGMILNYHEEFKVNQNITVWLKDNGVLVKNGEHVHDHFDIEEFVKHHIQNCHPAIYNSLSDMSSDEQNMYWESLYTPRMIIHQQGQVSSMIVQPKADSHLIIDWGDYSALQIVEGTEEQEIEHYYHSTGKHIITFYGDCNFSKLDFRELSGVYYPLSCIYADEFDTALDIDDLKNLLSQNEKRKPNIFRSCQHKKQLSSVDRTQQWSEQQ